LKNRRGGLDSQVQET